VNSSYLYDESREATRCKQASKQASKQAIKFSFATHRSAKKALPKHSKTGEVGGLEAKRDVLKNGSK
jgi:hypothetical protein